MIALAAGAAGFIILLNVSDAIDNKIGENLVILGGATIIDVERSDFDRHHPGEFHLVDIARLKHIPHVSEVAAIVSTENIEAAIGPTRLMVRLAGVDAAFWQTIMASCRLGRLTDNGDDDAGLTYAVLGENVAETLFGDMNPLGKALQIGNCSIKIVGVLGGIQGPDTLRSVFIPLSTARRRFLDMYPIKHLRMRVDHWREVENVVNEVRSVLTSVHSGYTDGLRVTHYPERIRRVQGTVHLVKILIYLVCTAVVGLGAFGAAYLMLASVDERTREIGLKKALGGSDLFVMVEFLTEALVICASAGVAGVALALLTCTVLNTFMDLNISMGLLAMSSAGGLAATLVIGLLSGAYPAAKASRMNPAMAMRFE